MNDKSVIRIGLIFIVVLIAGLAFYFINPSFHQNDLVVHDEGESFTQNDTAKEILLDDKTKFTLDKTVIKLLSPWVLKKAQLGVTKTSFWCEGDSTLCYVYTASNGTDEFYIGNYKIGKNVNFAIVPFQENLNNIPWTNTFRIYRLRPENTDPEASISNLNAGYEGSTEAVIPDSNAGPMVQIVGCIKDNVCVSSGVLPQDSVENESTYNNFINFLNSIEAN